MTPTANLTRADMVRAAAARYVVLTRSGRVGRLVRWDAPSQRGRARVETHAGTGFTIPLADVIEVDLENHR